MIRICTVIGSRANYASIRSALDCMQKSNEIESIIVCTASAVIDKYGLVADEINKDGHKISHYLYNLVEGDDPIAMVKTTAASMIDLSNVFKEVKPDYVITIGDRYETLATAIAASYMNIPLIHTMGGEVSGTLDESIRHSVTKLAHLHFVSNKDAMDRVISMGEKTSSVYNVGCPRIDYISNKKPLSLYELNEKLNSEGVGATLDLKKPFIVVLYHPVTSEINDMSNQINQVLMATLDNKFQYVILFPNSDSGTLSISSKIRSFRENNNLKNHRFFKHIKQHQYISLLHYAKCLIGNSSSGIRDSAFLGTPVINIGSRQAGRLSGDNVVNCKANSKDISEAINYQLKKGKYKQDFLYGDGNAGKKMVKILLEIEKPSSQKKIDY